MRKAIPMILLLSAAACGGGALKDEAKTALPNSTSLHMGSPRTGTAAAQNQLTVVGQSSAWFRTTVDVGLVFNVGVTWVLDLIEAVTNQPPTSCSASGDTCTWGPGSDATQANVFKLVVTRDGASFDYVLSAEPKSKPGSGFLTIVSGKATPSAQPHHGAGNFTVDFDAAAKLDNPHNDTGKLVVNYTNVGPLQITALFTGARDSDGVSVDNVAYAYANDTSGGGDLDVAVHNLTNNSELTLHSRWKNDGQGRADVGFLVNQGTTVNAHLSECWGLAPFNVVYFHSDLSAYFGPDAGVETSCAYAPASFSKQNVP